ncbi:Uncharacterized protein TCM_035457 [Theobroma cacao]|uniref:Uncharacterized protein n=1 Tax=Theobroma cacao TaxID=3641 RepID=A0A061FJ04_THECC|nr:Uncharacterized protein TCM_035457 [Theobroma cacao]
MWLFSRLKPLLKFMLLQLFVFPQVPVLDTDPTPQHSHGDRVLWPSNCKRKLRNSWTHSSWMPMSDTLDSKQCRLEMPVLMWYP